MSSFGNEMDDARLYLPPDAVQLSPAALKLAGDLFFTAQQRAPSIDWVIVFEWVTSARVKQNNDSQWTELGDGLDLCASDSEGVPPEIVRVEGDLRLAFKIPADVLAKAKQRRIDSTGREGFSIGLF